jgi:hypothetical protein
MKQWQRAKILYYTTTEDHHLNTATTLLIPTIFFFKIFNLRIPIVVNPYRKGIRDLRHHTMKMPAGL